MHKILDFQKLQTIEVNNDYFPYFVVDNTFKENTDTTTLANDFPDLEKGGSFLAANTDAGPSIRELILELESEEFKTLLENKFNLDLANSSLVTTLRGYSRKRDGQIHTDSESKIVTVLMYLNLNWQNEAHLRLLKGDNNLDDYITEIPCTMGSLVAFKVTKNCWHGFPPFEGKRLSIQMNYIHRESLKFHNLRHKLSSALKGLFSKK